MRKLAICSFAFYLLSCFFISEAAVKKEESSISEKPEIPVSLLYEAQASVQRGVDYLLKTQEKNGSWLDEPAITGLVCMALAQSGNQMKNREKISEVVDKGREFILSNVQDNGSIAGTKSKYVNYSTAIGLSALAIMNNPEDKELMKNARHFLIDLQLDEDNKNHPTEKSNAFYGGIGYGSGGPKVPDLSNTQWALEALYLTNYLDTEAQGASPEEIKKSDLAWKNAVKFLRAVQNVPESIDEQWLVEKRGKDGMDGGFVYKPGVSKANAKVNKDGEDIVSNQLGVPTYETRGLRSYGSMTYAGLKSMIYAKLDRDDPRVKAALKWAADNYNLTENPGMGPEGHYYYLQTFAKAHSVYGDEKIKTPDGKVHYWRIDLIKQLLGTQKGDGSWINEGPEKGVRYGRWMEGIPQLVTAYSLLAMQYALGEDINK